MLEQSGVKLEYCEGEIYATAGGTPAHAELAASITRVLGFVFPDVGALVANIAGVATHSPAQLPECHGKLLLDLL